MVNIIIRELQKEDMRAIEFIKNRLAEWWLSTPEEIEKKYIIPSFTNGFPYIYIAFNKAGDFVGKAFLTLEEKGPLNINNQLWLSALLVKEEYRGQGVAQKLIKVVEEKTKSLGYTDLYLDTTDASGYYNKIGGWETLGTDFWEKGKEELTIMRKKL